MADLDLVLDEAEQRLGALRGTAEYWEGEIDTALRGLGTKRTELRKTQALIGAYEDLLRANGR